MVHFGNVLNLQGTEIAKKWNFQWNRFASKGYIFYYTANVRYLKVNVQTFDIISELKCLYYFVV